jgi:hypothetical protein
MPPPQGRPLIDRALVRAMCADVRSKNGVSSGAIDKGSISPFVATAWQANRLQNQWQGWEGLRPQSAQVRGVRLLVLASRSEPLMVSLGP